VPFRDAAWERTSIQVFGGLSVTPDPDLPVQHEHRVDGNPAAVSGVFERHQPQLETSGRPAIDLEAGLSQLRRALLTRIIEA